MTIKQILNLPPAEDGDAKVQVNGKEFHQVKLVGQLMNIHAQQTYVTYIIDDGTGTISVKNFNKNDDEFESRKSSGLQENMYVKVFGRIDEFNGKKSINCFSILPIVDYNEITYHRLETIYVYLYNTRGPANALSKSQATNPVNSFGTTSSFGVKQEISMQNSYSSAHGLNLTPIQDAVYGVLASSKDVTVECIHNKLGGKFNLKVIRDAVEFLTSEGHVFSSTDDNHFSLCM